MRDKKKWLLQAEDFFLEGDFTAMRACAREILEKNVEDIDALALLAESSIYLEEIDFARRIHKNLKHRGGNNLRVLFVTSLLAGRDLHIEAEMHLLEKIFSVGKDSKLADTYAPIFERAVRRLIDIYFCLARPKKAVATLFLLSAYQKDIEKKRELYSKALFITNFYLLDQDISFKLHQGYQDFFRHMKPYAPIKEYATSNRKLRIGYISGDFRRHAVANFVMPFLRDYEKKDFTVFCYMLAAEDDITPNFRRLAVMWKNVADCTKEEIAQLIYQDRIDILVDLSGHTEYSALPILAYKPAPLIIHALGYRNTTGLSAVDYILSDEYSSPQGEKKYFTEDILRLPVSHFAYIPFYLENLPSLGKVPPSVHKKYITFASFNQFNKITDHTFRLWKHILAKVPKARLIIKCKLASLPIGRRRIQEKLLAHHFDLQRVELRPYSENYLEEYRDVDIALDTFPYTGGVTTAEALIMGVPVITLYGRSHGERFASSILHASNLDALIAQSEEEYLRKAIELAQNAEKLLKYHETLRTTLLKSHLMQGESYIKEVENIYRTIWEKYCQKVHQTNT